MYMPFLEARCTYVGNNLPPPVCMSVQQGRKSSSREDSLCLAALGPLGLGWDNLDWHNLHLAVGARL